MNISSILSQYNTACQESDFLFNPYTSAYEGKLFRDLGDPYLLPEDETPLAFCAQKEYRHGVVICLLLTDRSLYIPSNKKHPIPPISLTGITHVLPWHNTETEDLIRGLYVYYRDGSSLFIDQHLFLGARTDTLREIILRLLTLFAEPDRTPVTAFPKIVVDETPFGLKAARKADPSMEARITLGFAALSDPRYETLHARYDARIHSAFRRELPRLLYTHHNCFLPEDLLPETREALPLMAPGVPMDEICAVCTNDLGREGIRTGIVITANRLYYRFINDLVRYSTVGQIPLDGITKLTRSTESDKHFFITYDTGAIQPLAYAGSYLPDLFRAIDEILSTCITDDDHAHLHIQEGLIKYYEAREKEGLNAYHNSFFVSSTFKDMHYERDAIHDNVLPALNKLGAAYGQSISFCDLRWGVDTGDLESAEGARKVLTVCLNEIERCKPHMVILLGSRYGWIPDQDLIADAINGRNDFLLDDLEKSVTALEIEFGALSDPAEKERIFVYFRSLDGNVSDAYLAEDNYHAQKLAQLKERIRAVCGDRIRSYQLTFDASGNLLTDMKEFSSMIIHDLEASLLASWEQESTLSPMERELTLHSSYAGRKALQCSARQNLLINICERIDRGDSYLALTGPSGIGKSTVMAALSYVLRYAGADVVPLFCGLTGNSDQAFEILKLLLYALEERLGLEHFSPVNETDSLVEYRTKLHEVSAAYRASDLPRLVILVDAVDQLLEEALRENLRFLPGETDSQLSVLFSCTDDFRIPYGPDVLTLPPPENTREMVNGILKLHRRELENRVIDAIAAKRGSDNPLYVSLLVERLLMMNKADFDAIVHAGDGMDAISAHQCALIEQAPEDLNAMGADLLSEAAARISGPLVAEVTSYLAVSRHGLRDTDLEQLFRVRGIAWNALDLSLYLHYIAGLFLFRSDGRIDFAHKSLREGFAAREKDPLSRHREIALHLASLPDGDPIKESELFYHNIYSRDIPAIRTYIAALPEDNARKRYVAGLLVDACRIPGSDLLPRLLEAAPGEMIPAAFLLFMSAPFYNRYRLLADAEEKQVFAQQLLTLAQQIPGDKTAPASREALLECMDCVVLLGRSIRDPKLLPTQKARCLDLIEASRSLYADTNGRLAAPSLIRAYGSLARVMVRMQEPETEVLAVYQTAVELAETLYPMRRETNSRTRRAIAIAFSDIATYLGFEHVDYERYARRSLELYEENKAELGEPTDYNNVTFSYEDLAYYYQTVVEDNPRALAFYKKAQQALREALREDHRTRFLLRLGDACISMAQLLEKLDAAANHAEILHTLEDADGYFRLYDKEVPGGLTGGDIWNPAVTWEHLVRLYQKEDTAESRRKCTVLLERVIPFLRARLESVPSEELYNILYIYSRLLRARMNYAESEIDIYHRLIHEQIEIFDRMYAMKHDPEIKKLRKALKGLLLAKKITHRFS